MPIVGNARDVAESMKKTYGKDWEKVFYSTANKQGRKAENWKKKSAQEKLTELLDQVPDDGDLKEKEIAEAPASQGGIPGGLADGLPSATFPGDQLQEGTETETEEHGGPPGVATDIARDHLTEDPKYYDHLEKMEQLGSRIMKVSALVPQRQDSVVPGIKLPMKLVDQQTGQAPGAAAATPPPAGKPTDPAVAATQPPGAPPQGAPVVPGAPQVSMPMPKAASEIRTRLAAVRVRTLLARG